MELILVRHAKPDKNYNHLSEIGIQQAIRLHTLLKDKIKPHSLVFSSQLQRAIDTAKIASPKIFCIDARLNELNPNNDDRMMKILKDIVKGKTNPSFNKLLQKAYFENMSLVQDLKRLQEKQIILFTHQFRIISLLLCLKQKENSQKEFRNLYKSCRLPFAGFISCELSL